MKGNIEDIIIGLEVFCNLGRKGGSQNWLKGRLKGRAKNITTYRAPIQPMIIVGPRESSFERKTDRTVIRAKVIREDSTRTHEGA